MDTPEQEARFKDYVWRFSLAYGGGIVAVILFNIFIIELPSQGTNFAILLMAVYAVAAKFTYKTERLFTKQEKRKFAFYSTLTSVVVSTCFALPVLLLLYFVSPEDNIVLAIAEAPLWIWVVVLGFILPLYYFAQLFLYGSFNKNFLQQIEKQKTKADADAKT